MVPGARACTLRSVRANSPLFTFQPFLFSRSWVKTARHIIKLKSSMDVFVLCLHLGRTYTFQCRKKKQKRASEWLDFLVNVWFWSARKLESSSNWRRRFGLV